MWVNRARSLELLEGRFGEHNAILHDLFELLDSTLDRFAAQMNQSEFDRACGMVVAKARHLGQANYSLVLDGLGQESGALLRPLIECFELLQFFTADPARVRPALAGAVPKAGEVAQAVDSKFRGLRGYLNEHSSHFAFSPFALQHLVNFESATFRSSPVFSESTLDRNIKLLACVLVLIAIASVNSLQTIRPGCANDLAEIAERLHGRIKLFAASLGMTGGQWRHE